MVRPTKAVAFLVSVLSFGLLLLVSRPASAEPAGPDPETERATVRRLLREEKWSEARKIVDRIGASTEPLAARSAADELGFVIDVWAVSGRPRAAESKGSTVIDTAPD